MTDDRLMIEAELDSLLRLWHQWASGFNPARGYPTSIPTRRMHTISNQYADQNGALDRQIDDVVAQAIEAEWCQMEDPHKTAIAINARNLCTGSTVWKSVRLPEDKTAIAIILIEARNIMLKRLQDAELL